VRLERVAGPECPGCGCTDSEVVRAGRPARNGGWGGQSAVHRCGNCGKVWRVRVRASSESVEAETVEREQVPEGVVVYKSAVRGGATCPRCGRRPVPVVSAPAGDGGVRIRYHECPDCGWKGKSQERR